MKNKILLLIAVATLGLTATTLAQVPSYVPTNGLVGYWPFNGNANDESGNGNNGTVNGATLTSDRFGISNSAYIFNSNTIDVGNNNSLNIGINGITVSAWINENTGGNLWHVLGIRNQCGDFHYQLSSNYLPLGLAWGGITPGKNSLINSGLLATSNQWNNLIGTFDGNKWKLFYNSVIIDSLISPVTDIINLNLVFGNSGTCQYFQGSIDDIGIWNRALTQQEITDLYNSCQLSVSTQPSNQTINISNNAQFIVGSSDTNATYQWQTNLGLGFQNLNNAGQYNGTNNDTLTVANVAMNNNNQQFRCIINSGSCVDTSNVAVLTINNNVGIHEMAQHNLFSVFPNPAHNIINVKADYKLIGSVFTIYDNTGKSVQSGKINAAKTTIELSNLSGGVYLFSIGDNMKQTFKIIKE